MTLGEPYSFRSSFTPPSRALSVAGFSLKDLQLKGTGLEVVGRRGKFTRRGSGHFPSLSDSAVRLLRVASLVQNVWLEVYFRKV